MSRGITVTVRAWVASHTGLPSIYSSSAVRVSCGDRVLADGSGPVLVSDALAEPGVETVYTVGSATYGLTRAVGSASGGLVTDASGRGVPGLVAVDNGDPVSWKSSITRFSPRSWRWSAVDDPASGTSQVTLVDPSREADMWDVLQRHSVLVVGPARPTPGVPVRCVTVDSVSRKRLGVEGLLSFEVSWTEAVGASGAAPVVTWGEWRGYDGGWRSRTSAELAHLIAGMPS